MALRSSNRSSRGRGRRWSRQRKREEERERRGEGGGLDSAKVRRPGNWAETPDTAYDSLVLSLPRRTLTPMVPN